MSDKGALALLAEYGGESSDEEVSGPRVSTKRIHKDDNDEPKPKRLEKLPVPPFVLNHANKNIEDALLHDGRIRSFPHERGNWATYVYIPFVYNEGFKKILSSVFSVMGNEIHLMKIEDLHISLTRTVILKYHWIEPFMNTIKTNTSYFTKFIIMMDSLKIYCNEEKTRTFVGIEIKTGIDTLLKLVQCLDTCLAEFHLPSFYKDPSFHLSIAWCLGDCVDSLSKFLPELNSIFRDIMNEFPQEYWYVYVEHLVCKAGNKLFQFHLT